MLARIFVLLTKDPEFPPTPGKLFEIEGESDNSSSEEEGDWDPRAESGDEEAAEETASGGEESEISTRFLTLPLDLQEHLCIHDLLILDITCKKDLEKCDQYLALEGVKSVVVVGLSLKMFIKVSKIFEAQLDNYWSFLSIDSPSAELVTSLNELGPGIVRNILCEGNLRELTNLSLRFDSCFIYLQQLSLLPGNELARISPACDRLVINFQAIYQRPWNIDFCDFFLNAKYLHHVFFVNLYLGNNHQLFPAIIEASSRMPLTFVGIYTNRNSEADLQERIEFTKNFRRHNLMTSCFTTRECRTETHGLLTLCLFSGTYRTLTVSTVCYHALQHGRFLSRLCPDLIRCILEFLFPLPLE